MAAETRPNILFIFSDDHRYDLLGAVNPAIHTPNLDALANSGVRFDRAYVTTAICSPSRAAVLSGQYGTRNGVPTLSDPLTFPWATFANDLAAAGYATAQAGKWHLGTSPTAAGFQHYARINSNGSWFNRSVDSNIAGVPSGLGGTFYETVMADVVIDWVSNHVETASTQPFVMWWCNQVPHVNGSLEYPDVKTDPYNKVENTPWGSTGGYRANYNVADIPVPVNWYDHPAGWGGPGTKPGYLASSRFVTKSVSEDYGGLGGYTNPAPGVRNATLGEDNVQQHQLEYNAAINALDHEIGRVLGRIEDPNGDGDTSDSIADNTWVVFMGDNGWQTGHHRFTSKVLAYEEAVRVPLIVRAPGITPRIEQNFALNIDLTPMFYDLAGLTVPEHLQGLNLRTLVEDPAASWRNRFYYEGVITENSLGAEPLDAICTGQYKYIRTYASEADAQANTGIVFEELYDLLADPVEMLNQAANPGFSSIKVDMIAALEEEKASVAASPDPKRGGGLGLLVNPSFEETPYTTGWNNSETESASGLLGSTTSVKAPWNTRATLNQNISPLDTFTFDVYLSIAGTRTADSFRILLKSDGMTAIELRGGVGNALQVNHEGTYIDVTALSGGSNYPFPKDETIFFRIVGRGIGTPSASYDVAWSDPDSTQLSHAVDNITAFASSNSATTGSGITNVGFDRSNTAAHSYYVDELHLQAGIEPIPVADSELIIPLPPPPDKVVNISGIYPHLTMTNEEFAEVGVGAVVPWANRLWAITYTGHAPNGSTDKLYEITPDLDIIVREESIGGTPANRFIHAASQQLNIGHYFIDTNRNVRVLDYSVAPGRPTGTAAHLTDPDNRLYIMTMENGVYDVNVHDLSFITRYPDVQGKGDRFLHGYHGKGFYSGQGQLVAANNGRPKNQSSPSGAAGVLATWDGTTVADNGGSYFATNDPNTGEGDNTGAPKTAQPEYMAGWTQHHKVQHCEVTGPGGIYGNSNPETDPIWATGFDDKSVVLRVMEDGATWNTWRLPKGSYTHDGSHGWHTEWPRIRPLDPSDPATVYLMHMHGIFYDFPKTFSSANFGGLSPICSYYKMPTDYCLFQGKLVMGKDDASLFSNPLTKRTQSNLWFGELDDLYDWGSPHGHGAVWKNEEVSAGAVSEPFLINGFNQGTLHFRNNGGTTVPVVIQTSNGDDGWSTQRTVTVPANSYLPENINNLTQEWVRLQTSASSSNLTAFFTLSNPYPHATPASLISDEFAPLADIKDTTGYSDGLLRVMAGSTLEMEMTAAHIDSSGELTSNGYFRIGGPLVLNEINSSSAENGLRADAETSKEFGGDAASVWTTDDVSGVRLRLPRGDVAYDQPFPSGWPRGYREIVTERSLLNCHGTFYEIPRKNSAGRYRMRPITTHGKRITDFTAWRGLLVLSGVLDDAPESDRLVRNPSGAAIWLGEADDLWQMGEPRGYGGPWLHTAVEAEAVSDAYLMYGYDHKELSLSHTATSNVTFTVEVDFLADHTWSVYQTFIVAPGETVIHTFPDGYRAHWVRLKSDTTTTATAQLTYGPIEQHDELLDWARDQGLPTTSGRSGLVGRHDDNDDLDAISEFFYGGDPFATDPSPLSIDGLQVSFVGRDLATAQGVALNLWGAEQLGTNWTLRSDLELSPVDQSGVGAGYLRRAFKFDASTNVYFLMFDVEPAS